jgi:hypothetical protein
MSIPQTNFENNNRMSELTKNINYIFGYVLLYSVIIFTTLSAVFGGVVVYPIYAVICIIKKIRSVIQCYKSAASNEVEEVSNEVEEVEEEAVKKPIIDENWCNISVKNIINYTSEATVVNSEADASEADASEADASEADASEADVEDISNAEVVNSSEADASEAEVEEEILSIRRPSEEELRKKEEEENESEADANEIVDNSPNDKYSIGHYKSKTHINDPLDFDN